jgi:exosome complex RNA-binding protein Csl4
MSIQTVNAEILQGNFTNDQLTSIIDAVKFARARLTEKTKRSLRIGDNVNFNSTKQGRNVTGIVMKIAIKYVTVQTSTGMWRVPANMLTVIEDMADPMNDFNYVGSRHHY